MAKPKHPRTTLPPEEQSLTPFERKYVAAYEGHQANAAIKAGSKSKTPDRIGQQVHNRPRVQAALKKKQDAFIVKVGQTEAKRFLLDRSHLDERLLRQLDKHLTHQSRGDQDYYTGIRTGYESLQLIEGPKTINHATANAASAVNSTYEVFKSGWKIAREQDMARRADAELTASL